MRTLRILAAVLLTVGSLALTPASPPMPAAADTPMPGDPGTVSTIVGGPGRGMDQSELSLIEPRHLTLDPVTGDVLVTSNGRDTVYRIGGDGVAEPVLGVGHFTRQPDGSGDGGPAVHAPHPAPISAVVHPATGDVYSARGLTGDLRRVDASTRTVTSVAHIGGPSHAVWDPVGERILISDYTGCRLLGYNPASDTLTHIAGNGGCTGGGIGDGGPALDAALARPGPIAVDPANGEILIGELTGSATSRIRRIDASTGTITTWAGGGSNTANGTHRLDASLRLAGSNPSSGLSGFALDPTTGDLFYSETGRGDSNQSRIRRIDGTSGELAHVAGVGRSGYLGDGSQATAARLGSPQGLLLHDGSLLVADGTSNRIRAVDLTTGVIDTWAGSGRSHAESVDALDGQIVPRYVAGDASGETTWVISGVGTSESVLLRAGHDGLTVWAGLGSTAQPADGSILDVTAGLGAPRRIVASPDGQYLYVATAGLIYRVDVSSRQVEYLVGGGTGGWSDGVPGLSAALASSIRDFSLDSTTGDLFVALNSSGGRCRIIHWDSIADVVSTVAGTGACSASGGSGDALSVPVQPTTLAYDTIGHRVLFDAGASGVRALDLTASTVETWRTAGSPIGLLRTDPGGFVYSIGLGSGAHPGVEWWAPDGQYLPAFGRSGSPTDEGGLLQTLTADGAVTGSGRLLVATPDHRRVMQAMAPPLVVAVDDQVTIGQGETVDLDVLANDVVVQPITSSSPTVVVGPGYGRVSRAAPDRVRYEPLSAFVGTDSFSYEICPITPGVCDTATVTVTVLGLNQPPIVLPDVYATGIGEPVVIQPLNNDSDPENDDLTIDDNSSPTSGVVACQGIDCVYTPDVGFVGVDTFTVDVTDGGHAVTSRVTVHVRPEPLVPTGFWDADVAELPVEIGDAVQPLTGFHLDARCYIGHPRVTVSWSPIGDVEYRIERRADGGPWVQVSTVAGTEYQDSLLGAGQPVEYRIVAVAGSWESPPSPIEGPVSVAASCYS